MHACVLKFIYTYNELLLVSANYVAIIRNVKIKSLESLKA